LTVHDHEEGDGRTPRKTPAPREKAPDDEAPREKAPDDEAPRDKAPRDKAPHIHPSGAGTLAPGGLDAWTQRIAADQLEPFTARVTLEARSEIEAPASLVGGVLEEIARRAAKAGSSIIGHLKCRGAIDRGAFHCNLTSVRHGARCQGAESVRLEPGDRMELDLAVLIYGLTGSKLASITREAFSAALPASVAEWGIHSGHSHEAEEGIHSAGHSHEGDR
jgi:hypothetical protein